MEPRNANKPPRDEYAEGSFTWRRMTWGQIIGLIVVLLIILAVFVWWG